MLELQFQNFLPRKTIFTNIFMKKYQQFENLILFKNNNIQVTVKLKN